RAAPAKNPRRGGFSKPAPIPAACKATRSAADAVPRALSAGDERAHRARLVFDFVEPVLDDVADADDAAQPAVLDHREMADAAVRHFRHQLVDGIRQLASHHPPGHHLGDVERQQSGSVVGHAVHDVALRDDPVDGFAVLADDEGADIAGNQLLHSGADRLVRPDRRHRTPLGAQNALDVHRRPPMMDAGAGAPVEASSLGQNAASGNKSPRARAAGITMSSMDPQRGTEMGRIQINEVSLELLTAGDGPPLLFLHGGDYFAQHREFFDKLARCWRVVVPRHPGFGNSERPEGFRTVHDLAYLYLDLLERQDFGKVTGAGSSFGGWIA